MHNRNKRQEQLGRIMDYIIMKGSIQYRELNRVLIWLNSLIYMNYKIVTNNYLSVLSNDTVAWISPCYRGKNGSLIPIGNKGRFLLMVNVENKTNGNDRI